MPMTPMISVDKSRMPTVYIGTPSEVHAALQNSCADTVILLTFPRMDMPTAEKVWAGLTEFVRCYIDAAQKNQEGLILQRLTQALLPHTPVPPHGIKEMCAQAAARRIVLESGDWLTTAEVAGLAGFRGNNPGSQVLGWKRRGLIFAIRHKGRDYVPLYALEADEGFRPNKYLADVIRVFAGHKDGWGMAYWFNSPNSYLGGKHPKDLLASEPDRVIFAAHQETRPITHG